jgi:hypothetical protein
MSGGYDQMWLPNFMKHEEMSKLFIINHLT